MLKTFMEPRARNEAKVSAMRRNQTTADRGQASCQSKMQTGYRKRAPPLARERFGPRYRHYQHTNKQHRFTITYYLHTVDRSTYCAVMIAQSELRAMPPPWSLLALVAIQSYVHYQSPATRATRSIQNRSTDAPILCTIARADTIRPHHIFFFFFLNKVSLGLLSKMAQRCIYTITTYITLYII
jgi:hypothetical protein